MKTPFCEILCSPEVAHQIGLNRRDWILTKAGFGFENWVWKDKSKKSRAKKVAPETWKDRQRAEALRLFRVVQGEGDAGSELEFNCRHLTEQSGWLRLAAQLIF